MSDDAPLSAEGSFLERLIARKGLRQFVKFGIVGFSGLLVNLVIFTLLQRVVPHPTEASTFYAIYSIGFLTGGISNYFLNRKWTFRSDAHAGKQGAQFIIVSLIALAVSLIVSHFAVSVLGLGHGHKTWFLATCAAIIVNFFVNKYWTFRGH